MLPLGEVVTPTEYKLLLPAIKTDWDREATHDEEAGPNFDYIQAAYIPLGALGEGIVVYFQHVPECGATGNCPMAIYVREANGYRRVIDTGGWGATPLSSGSPVPDVAFYSHMSAAETDSDVFHYANGRFVERGGARCTDENLQSDRVCAGMRATAPTYQAVSPAEYDALLSQLKSDLEKQFPAQAAQTDFDQAHAANILNINQTVITAVELEPCDANGNCRISVYAHGDGIGYLPLLLNADGWSASNTWSPPGLAIVVARHLSASQAELTEYKLTSTRGLHVLGPDARLELKACEDITAKANSWPTNWDPTAFAVEPASCSKTQ